MHESTYRILNNYDLEIPFSFSISFRNTLTIICPFLTALLVGVLVLLRDAELYSVWFTVAVVYVLLGAVGVVTVLIYKFLTERRKFLMHNKLEYLKKKYAKLASSD